MDPIVDSSPTSMADIEVKYIHLSYFVEEPVSLKRVTVDEMQKIVGTLSNE